MKTSTKLLILVALIVTASNLLATQRSVDPLILPQWHSSDPWNARCPGTTGNRANAGSHALALAKTMKYWAYPSAGTGSVSYVDDDYGNINSNFSPTINWDGMSNTLVFQTTQRYIFMCGASVFTDYELQNSSSSLANVRGSLINYFSYDPAMQIRARGDFTNFYWKAMIRAELDASRPVIYTVTLANGREVALLVDGYDEDGLFHINWSDVNISDAWVELNSLSYMGEAIPETAQQMLTGIRPSLGPVSIDAPTGIDASLLPSGILRISWDAVTGASGYNLYRSIDGGNSFTMVAQTANDYYDDAVTLPVWELRIYHYRVSAVSGRVESEPSEILSVALDRIASVGNSLLGIPLGAGVWVSEWVQGQSFMIDSVSYWDANIQQWMTAFDLGGFWDGDFQLSEGMVILLSSYSAPYYTLFTSTSSLGGDYSISIAQGYNLILVPPGLDPDLDSVQEMAGDIGPGVESISLWDTEHTLWKQYCPQYPSYDWGALQPWQRLFIYSTVAYPNWYAPRGGVK